MERGEQRVVRSCPRYSEDPARIYRSGDGIRAAAALALNHDSAMGRGRWPTCFGKCCPRRLSAAGRRSEAAQAAGRDRCGKAAAGARSLNHQGAGRAGARRAFLLCFCDTRRASFTARLIDVDAGLSEAEAF